MFPYPFAPLTDSLILTLELMLCIYYNDGPIWIYLYLLKSIVYIGFTLCCTIQWVFTNVESHVSTLTVSYRIASFLQTLWFTYSSFMPFPKTQAAIDLFAVSTIALSFHNSVELGSYRE